MADITAVLEGGSRDGESTELNVHVTRLYAASDAPGLLDVYESTGDRRHLRGNEVDAVVFRFVERVSAEDVAPEAIHMPSPRP